MVSSILLQYKSKCMKKIGLYTSPHLRFVRERIQINNEPLSEEKFTKYFFEIWDKLEAAAEDAGHPNPRDPSTKPVYFRFLTLMAFHAYLKEQVNTAVIECGIGGEYDSTNILANPSVTGITNLGIDHTVILGDTIEEIAWHKAGIFKPGVSAYTVPQPNSALKVLKQRAKERNTKLRIVEPHPDLDDIQLGLDAEFQKTNASLAIYLAAAHLHNTQGISFPHPSILGWGPLPPEFVAGLEQVRWPGRCEIRHEKNLTWYIDGGHTLESIAFTGKWFVSRILSTSSSSQRASSTQSTSQSPPSPPSSSNEKSTALPPTRILIFNQQVRSAHPLALSLHNTLSTALSTPHPFTHVIFCTNMTFKSAGFSPDLVSVNTNNADVESLIVQRGLAEMWRRVDPVAEVDVVRTIEEAVERVRGLAERGRGDETRMEGRLGKVEVLVTGSLHLVGGLIDVLESQPAPEEDR